MKEAKQDNDLDRIPTTRRYQARANRRIKRLGITDGNTETEWRKDAGEYAQKIWAWWKPRKDKFPYHGLAVRLLVLAQLSSCSVERVFSILEQTRRAAGDHLKEDMMELRLLLQVNGELDEMYNDLVLNYDGNV